MVPTSYEAKSVYELFSPPYGDGTKIINCTPHCVKFSPPYGDGTVSIDCKVSKDWFSPPYGDGTAV